MMSDGTLKWMNYFLIVGVGVVFLYLAYGGISSYKTNTSLLVELQAELDTLRSQPQIDTLQSILNKVESDLRVCSHDLTKIFSGLADLTSTCGAPPELIVVGK